MDYRNPQDFRTTEATKNTANQQKARYTQAPSISSLSNFQVVANVGGSVGGVTVSFKLVKTIEGIASIRLLRGDTAGFNTAKPLQSWTPNSGDLTKQFSFVDVDPILKLRNNYYWLQLIPVSTVAPSPVISNSTPLYTLGPQVLGQLGAAQLPPAQIQAFSVSLGAGSGGFQTGYFNFLAPNDPNFAFCLVDATGYNGNPNQVRLLDAGSSPFSYEFIQTGETITLTAFAVSLTGLVNTSSPLTASVTLNGSATAPATMFSVSAVKIGGGTGGIQVSWSASIDNITLYTIYRSAPGAGSGAATSIGTVTPSSGTAAYSFLDSTAVNQNFDYYVKATNSAGTSAFSNTATSQGVTDRRGNVTFSITDGFSFTVTTTTANITWTGLVIYRSDGTTTTIPDSSQAITGLTASTLYNVFPYWDEVSQTLMFVLGALSGAVPAIAFTSPTILQLQQQELLSHISLAAGSMQFTTTASGSGGGTGGGGGGGGGGCFTGSVSIKTPSGFIRFDELPGIFLVENETGTHTADLLVHENYESEMVDLGFGLVTTNHLMKVDENTWLQAGEFYNDLPRVKFVGTVYNLHVRTNSDVNRHYVLENGDVAHNFKPF